jgi:hypothetical protein
MSNVVNKLDKSMAKNRRWLRDDDNNDQATQAGNMCTETLFAADYQTHFIRQVKSFTLVAFTFIIIKYLTHMYFQESQVTCPCSTYSSP